MLTVTYSLADQDFHTTKSVGIFNLSLHLLRHLALHPQMESLTVLGNSTFTNNGLNLPERVRVQMHDEAIAGRLRRIWWDQSGVYQAAAHAGQEWLILPKGFASFLGPCPVKLALYVHDVILESYYRHHPSMSRLELAYFNRCFRANLKHAQVIFTNSEFTRREIEQLAQEWGLTPPRLVPIGIGFEAPATVTTPRENRVLVLASPLYHKRTDLALEYLSRWQTQTRYAGTVEWVGQWPKGLALPAFANWRHHPRLPETEFRQALQRAQALVFFSEYEGFGMPPVEAALAGVCPVYSDISATREVMSGAGWAFQNHSYESFVQALEAGLKTPPAQVESWKQTLSRRFTWQQVCDRLVETLASIP